MADDTYFRQVFAADAADYVPSAKDLYMALPRLARRLFASGNSSLSANASLASDAFAQHGGGAAAEPAGFLPSFLRMVSWSKLSNLDGIFSYIASRWALSTFMIAIVLNRAHVYSAPRRHVHLNWQTRLMLRILPIAAFLYQIVRLLQATRCQAGDFIPRLVHRDSQTVINNAFAGDSGFLYKMSATLLFWQDDAGSCFDSGMVPAGDDKMDFIGSATVLWPLFLTLCLSHLVETISCSLEGRQPMAETGMTIFEHSLAFAEAEAVVRSSIGMGLWGMPSTFAPPAPAKAEISSESSGVATTFTRDMIMTRLNVPPEVMLIGLISCASHISNHTLAIIGIQSKCRLLNTSVWGLCYMTAFAWSFWKSSRPITEADLSVLRYPTVCIIGFIPHLLIVAGIFICAVIYAVSLVALALSAFNDGPPGSPSRPWRERLQLALSNMQANTSLSNIHISLHEEFYTTLLKVGFTMLTMASQAVYFNEGTSVSVASRTWLEEKRLLQLAQMRRLTTRIRSIVPPELQGDFSIADGVGLVEEPFAQDSAYATSGYTRERKTTQKVNKAGMAATREDGVGGHQRSGRWYLSWRLLSETLTLLKCCLAKWLLIAIEKIGVTQVPQWLRDASSFTSEKDAPVAKTSALSQPSVRTLQFYMLSDEGELVVANDLNTDVELETRRRLLRSDPATFSERTLDDNLYNWWKSNGWQGEVDASGDYIPPPMDDDLTSVISEATSSSAWESESEMSDGRRTPTQEDFQPENPLKDLVRLLHPRSLEDKQEAQLLAQRLTRSGPMTRSQYRASAGRDNARLLMPGVNRNMSPQEEEELLELLIQSKRTAAASRRNAHGATSSHASTSWTSGAAGLGDSGPQCVVCHDAPRTILVWPCRCLSLCENCRVDLAMNNYGTCVCCRRDVVAFSRLYVP